MIGRLGSISCTGGGVTRLNRYLRVWPATEVNGATAWDKIGPRPSFRLSHAREPKAAVDLAGSKVATSGRAWASPLSGRALPGKLENSWVGSAFFPLHNPGTGRMVQRKVLASKVQSHRPLSSLWPLDSGFRAPQSFQYSSHAPSSL